MGRSNSKDPSDRTCNRSRGTAYDRTDRPGRTATCVRALLSATDCALSTSRAGRYQRNE